MLRSSLLIALVLVTVVQTLHLHDTSTLVAGNVTLAADNGQLLRVCRNCGGAVADSASIQAINDGSQVWALEVVGSKVAFKGNNGKYLSRCNGCWPGSKILDSATVHSPNINPATLWTP